MWHKNFIFVNISELWSQSSYSLHNIHSHSHLILDPESAFDDDLRGGFASSEVIVKCRFRIQDQVAVAVDFTQNIRTFGQKFLYLTKIEVLIPHHAFYQ